MEQGNWSEDRSDVYTVTLTVRDEDHMQNDDETRVVLRYIPEDRYQQGSKSGSARLIAYFIIVLVVALMAVTYYIYLIRRSVRPPTDKIKP